MPLFHRAYATFCLMLGQSWVSYINGMVIPLNVKRCYIRSSLKMMPEGPEVRSLVDSISSRFKGSNWHLTSAAIVSGRYAKAAPENWDNMLGKLPAEVKDIKCKGKFIYFECGDFYIFNTLGLSGGWSLSSSKAYTRASFILTKDNGDTKNLNFYDMIGYGTIKVCLTKDELDKKLKKVGTCWLEEKPSFEDFLAKVKKTKPNRPLVVFLMDQTKLAGIGNYILSEVLYRTKIHPWALCGDISDEILLELYEAIVTVIYSSYLSQQPGDSYYPGLTDAKDDHNGLISQEVLAKNTISLKDLKKKISPSTSPVSSEKPTTSIWYSKAANSLDFRFQAYSQQICPLGNQIIKQEGLHKRSIHWVPSLQTRCTPANGIDTTIVKKRSTRKKVVKET